MPVSLSVVSKLSPKRFTSIMLGIYYVVFSVAEILAGQYASALPIPEPTKLFGIIPIANLSSFFLGFVIVGFVSAGIWLLLRNKIKSLSHGIL